jgi:hypothetical protein
MQSSRWDTEIVPTRPLPILLLLTAFFIGCVRHWEESESVSSDELITSAFFVGRITILTRESIVVDGDVCGFRYTAAVKTDLAGSRKEIVFFGPLAQSEMRISGRDYFAVVFKTPRSEQRLRCLRDLPYVQSRPATLLPFADTVTSEGEQIVSEGESVLSLTNLPRQRVDTGGKLPRELFSWGAVAEYVRTLARNRAPIQ